MVFSILIVSVYPKYSSKDVKNRYVIEISEQRVYSYSFGGGEHHMVDKAVVLGKFYCDIIDNELVFDYGNI